jgi:hypothetical protein
VGSAKMPVRASMRVSYSLFMAQREYVADGLRQ